MFAIKDGRLFVAEQNIDYSHAVWFVRLGWSTNGNVDSMINTVTRGSLEQSGLYFYKGYDFIYDEQSTRDFLDCLRELATELKVPLNTHVYGGKIVEIPGKNALPRKDFGTIAQLLKT